MKKLMKRIMIICIVIIVIELVIMLIMKFNREKKLNHLNLLNSAIKVDNGYIVVGESDFYNSKDVAEKIYDFQGHNIIANRARIAKLDEEFKLVWEKSIDTDYDATYYDVLETNDGYIAVGSKVKNKESVQDNVREALIVKYDKSGKIIWDKTYSVLSDSEFYKIIDDGDNNYVVVGQSIYENMEMGTHITGGGIIVRYNSEGELLAHNNYGGNKSGSFNDIIKVKDGYIVCGKDAVNYGILVKFKKDFDRDEEDLNLITKKVLWQRTYANTDTIGFTSMAQNGDKLYLAGSINISKDKDDAGNTKFKYVSGIVEYNTSGKYIGKYSTDEDVHHRFNSILINDNKLYVSKELDVDSYYDGGKRNSAIVTYKLVDDISKLGNNILETKEFIYDNDYVINKIMLLNNKKYYIGTANTECNLSGCDYQDVLEKYEEASK